MSMRDRLQNSSLWCSKPRTWLVDAFVIVPHIAVLVIRSTTGFSGRAHFSQTVYPASFCSHRMTREESAYYKIIADSIPPVFSRDEGLEAKE